MRKNRTQGRLRSGKKTKAERQRIERILSAPGTALTVPVLAEKIAVEEMAYADETPIYQLLSKLSEAMKIDFYNSVGTTLNGNLRTFTRDIVRRCYRGTMFSVHLRLTDDLNDRMGPDGLNVVIDCGSEVATADILPYLAECERLSPGAGSYILWLLAGGPFYIMGPDHVREYLSWTYWEGYDDETELKARGEEYSGPTLADFEAAYPPFSRGILREEMTMDCNRLPRGLREPLYFLQKYRMPKNMGGMCAGGDLPLVFLDCPDKNLGQMVMDSMLNGANCGDEMISPIRIHFDGIDRDFNVLRSYLEGLFYCLDATEKVLAALDPNLYQTNDQEPIDNHGCSARIPIHA